MFEQAKKKCVAICQYCDNYQAGYVGAIFDDEGLCVDKNIKTELTYSCEDFECSEIEYEV